MSFLEVLRSSRIVPVVVLDDAASAVPLAAALLAGGIDVIEVTLRTAAGLDAIAALAHDATIHTGAGSVLTPSQVDEAVAAGAEFIVSPGFSVPVIERALDLGVAVLPGAPTPSDLMTAVAMGLEVVKFFPAAVLGGPAAIKALSAPFTGLAFVPTGGIGPANLASYLGLSSVAAVGGSWMVEHDLVTAGDWQEITDRSTAAVRLAKAA